MQRTIRKLFGASLLFGLVWVTQPTVHGQEYCTDLTTFCYESSNGACYAQVFSCEGYLCDIWCIGCGWHTECMDA
jgi:hypothetical protein